jgi:hypothetical protein
MAEIMTVTKYVLTVNTDEMTLILKALGGRLREERGELERAKQLGDLLTTLRAQEASNQATNLSVHANKVRTQS